MKPPPFSYHSPATVAETVGLLTSLDDAMLLAGGQSLMPMLNMRYAQPDHVIDLNQVEGLDQISESGSRLEIGAMARQRDVEKSDLVKRCCPLLAICAASDAVIRVQGPKGERDIPFAEFSLGFMTTAMELDEMLVSIRIPLWGEGHGYAFEEFARRHGDFAIVSAAALLTAAPDGSITRASLTIGGAGSSALRMGEAESFLVGQQAGPENFEKASEICRGIDAIGDVHAPADYRRQLAVELALRALERAWARI